MYLQELILQALYRSHLFYVMALKVKTDWLQRSFVLRKLFLVEFSLSPRWPAQLVCTAAEDTILCFHWMQIQKRNTIYRRLDRPSLNGNSKEKYNLETPWQGVRSTKGKKHGMLRCARSACWLDFYFLSVFFSIFCPPARVSMALPDVYMIFGIIWRVANGQFWRVMFFPHFWSPCLPCFDGSCFPNWVKTGWGPFSVNFDISKLFCHIFYPRFAISSCPRFSNPVTYLSTSV